MNMGFFGYRVYKGIQGELEYTILLQGEQEYTWCTRVYRVHRVYKGIQSHGVLEYTGCTRVYMVY